MANWLKSVNDFLEQVPASTITAFNHIFKKGEEYTQDFVDSVCIWLAWSVNVNVERMRQRVIKYLADHYKGTLRVASAVNVVKNAVTDPIGTAGAVFSYFSKPFSAAKEFMSMLIVEIPRLASNLANIAESLPPSPPNPHINFDAFKLRVGTISLSEIMGSPTMPTPEQMFPEPPSPFSKAAFDKSFENATAETAEDQIVYKLKEENTSAISQSIIDNISDRNA